MNDKTDKRSKISIPLPPPLINWRAGALLVHAPAEKTDSSSRAYASPKILRIEPGVNAPMSPAEWEVMSNEIMIKEAMEGKEPVLAKFTDTESVHPRMVGDLLKNCASLDGVKHWRKRESRRDVLEDIDAWIVVQEARLAPRKTA